MLIHSKAEGSIRIFRDYEIPGETALASTFRAVSETYPVAHSSGLLTAWEQQKGHLLVGGDMKVVRLWDATVERHLRVSPIGFYPRLFVHHVNRILLRKLDLILLPSLLTSQTATCSLQALVMVSLDCLISVQKMPAKWY